MDTGELWEGLIALTPIERRRLETGEELPSAYYQMLDAVGRGPTADGVYHLSLGHETPHLTPATDDRGVTARLNSSPLQDYLIVKRASRFYHEPFATCDALCIRYVYSGTSVMRFGRDAREMTLKEGDMCLLSSGFALSQYLGSPEDLVFTLIFTRECLIRNVIEPLRERNIITRVCVNHVMQQRSEGNYVLFHGAGSTRIRDVVGSILLEYVEPDDYSKDAVDALVQLLVLEMLRCPYEVDDTPEGIRDSNVAAMLHYCDTHFQDVSLHDLATRFGYSEKYLSRLFKKAAGRTFTAYVAHRRMLHAASLLRDTTLSVRDVATTCGLENMSHFYRLFADEFGCTPKEYRLAGGTCA